MEVYYGGLDNLFLWMLALPLLAGLIVPVLIIDVKERRRKYAKRIRRAAR